MGSETGLQLRRRRGLPLHVVGAQHGGQPHGLSSYPAGCRSGDVRSRGSHNGDKAEQLPAHLALTVEKAVKPPNRQPEHPHCGTPDKAPVPRYDLLCLERQPALQLDLAVHPQPDGTRKPRSRSYGVFKIPPHSFRQEGQLRGLEDMLVPAHRLPKLFHLHTFGHGHPLAGTLPPINPQRPELPPVAKTR